MTSSTANPTPDITTTNTTTNSTTNSTTAQQLSLLPTADVPLQFRLDAATRRRGLRHVAEIRQLLADRQAAREHQRSGPVSAQRQHRAA
jgi:hypothetical protein